MLMSASVFPNRGTAYLGHCVAVVVTTMSVRVHYVPGPLRLGCSARVPCACGVQRIDVRLRSAQAIAFANIGSVRLTISWSHHCPNQWPNIGSVFQVSNPHQLPTQQSFRYSTKLPLFNKASPGLINSPRVFKLAWRWTHHSRSIARTRQTRAQFKKPGSLSTRQKRRSGPSQAQRSL